jgi:MFS family permease
MILFMVKDLKFLWLGYLFLGLSAGIMICVTFNYMAEILPRDQKARCTTLVNIAPSVIGVLYALSFKFLTKWWQELQFFGLLASFIGAYLVLGICESPKYLFMKK